MSDGKGDYSHVENDMNSRADNLDTLSRVSDFVPEYFAGKRPMDLLRGSYKLVFGFFISF